MKKLILFIFAIISFTAFSQSIGNTRTIEDPIELTPLDPVDSTNPSDPIELTPFDPLNPVDPGQTIPATPGYHDTQGKLEISNSGHVNYILPIALPPSIHNVGPTINLVYSSGQFGGIAGQGWSINSISTIARVATRKDIDGFVDGVDFDDNDKLALDGQRLILVSGNYWADGSIYKTEVLSNSKIELKGSGSSIYFIVTAPDGSRSWYGNFGGQNATDLNAFYIVRFEDTNGNFMTYQYNKPLNKSLCISEIKFSANVNGLNSPLNKITFNYVPAKRVENLFIKGVKHEKVELLKSIFVYTNNQLFRRYAITHSIDPQLGYERVIQLQEFNSNNESANPIIFEYPNTVMDNTNSESLTTYTNNLNFNDVVLSGDFDGDGRLDFVTQNQLYRNLFQGGSAPAPINLSINVNKRQSFVATTLDNNNKVNQNQSLVYAYETTSGVSFRMYNLVGNTLTITNQKDISINNQGQALQCTNYGPINGNGPFYYQKDSNLYYEGDFNGDGTSDVLMLSTINEKANNGYGYYSGGCTQFSRTNGGVRYNIINLNQVSSIGEPNLFPINNSYIAGDAINTVYIENPNDNLKNNLRYISDFNGDGKSDLLIINPYSKDYKVLTFNFSQNTILMEKIGEGNLDEFSDSKQLLFGDFNGDGKTDLMLPDTEGGEGHTLWHIYYSNPKPAGGSLFEKESHNIVEYRPDTGVPGSPGASYSTQVHYSSYYAMDTNGDGKSDLVRIWRKHYKVQGLFAWNDHDTQWKVTSFVNNIGNTQVTGNKFQLDYETPCQTVQVPTGSISNCNHNSDSPGLIVPIVSSYRYGGLKQDLVIVHNHYNRIFYIKFKKNVAEDIRVKKITSSGGNIVDQIEYKSLEPTTTSNNGQGALNEFYSSNNSVNYPFVELKRIPDYYLVSKLVNSTEGVTKSQDFRYHGLVFNLQGLGAIGLTKTARSAWYINATQKRLWNVNENNHIWRGALKRTYSQLVNNGGAFTFVNSGNPSGIVNSTENSFEGYNSNGSYFLFLISKTTKDFITGVSTQTLYEYDYTYLLPIAVTTKNYTTSPSAAIGTKVTITSFNNNPTGLGADYHIGRPLEISTVTIAYGGTATTNEIFTYSNNKLIKTEKRGNTSGSKYLVEEFEYNSVGNVKKKTLSAIGSDFLPNEIFTPRVTEYTYDSTERFVKTSKDIEGLISTNVSYHPLYGIVTETLSPYGLTSKVFIDHWGKIFKTTDYLGKNTIVNYSKSGNEYTISKVGEDVSASIQINDALARPKKTGQKNIDGTWSYKAFEYDYLGRKFKESEPFSSGNPTQWKITTFDDYSRQKTVQYPSGLTTTLTYVGLTVTGTDGLKTTSSTKNANGHVISSTDNGGTITYQYYPDGNLKNSNYSGTIVSMEYDEWGRKKKLNDPSAGEYTYTYNAIGDLLTETTPNGTTSNVYDDFGNILETTIIGTNTDSKTTYSYDGTSKLLTSILFEDFNNGGTYDQYDYAYDSYKRLYSTVENKFGSFYQRVTLFDEFGRPEKESYSTIAAGKQSTKWVKNTYKNGYLWKILDDATNQVLWQTNTVNARGQLLSANLGNGVSISNTYDNFGFPTQFKHDKTGNENLMTLNTSFNQQRGNLTSRYNSMFYWNESFQYDNQDRLQTYTNNKGQQVQQIYESDGRIKENNLGTYNYTNTSKKYQNTSINLNPESKAYYENRLGIFNDGMESKQGWAIYEPLVFSFDESVKRSGNVSLKIANTTSTEKIIHSESWTSISNQAPTQYTYSAWVKSDGTNPQAEIFLFMKTETESGYFTLVDNKVSATSDNWVLIEKTFLVPANIKKISIRLDSNGTGNLWFDDIRIRKTSDNDTGDRKLNISYNTWKSPYLIEETNVDKISFTYNYMNNRSDMYYGGLQTDKNQRQFRKSYSADGTMEVKMNNLTNEVEFITYIGGDAYTAPVVLKSDGTTQNYLYLHRDYLGSIVAISNQEGNVIEKRLFDAWGEVIKVQDGSGNVLNGFKVLDRGYTGHEHLTSVGLIHMNGRLYDAKLHRFLQPDNYIQDPHNTQNYNRYAYVLNNPLKYTDPSGEEAISSFTAAVIIGAVIAATTYSIKASYTYGFQASGWGLFKATFIGAVSAAVTHGIGTYASTITNFADKIVFQAFAHGTSQAFFTGIQGGNPMVGFASGSLSSIASSAFSFDGNGSAPGLGWGSSVRESGAGMIAFGTVSGGAGAYLTGGNFWEGAATGLVVSGLNHWAHPNKTPNTDWQSYFKKKSEDFIYFTADFTIAPLVIEQVMIDSGFSEWKTSYADSKVIDHAAAGALATLSYDLGLGRLATAGAGMLGVHNTWSVQYRAAYHTLSQKLWYGKVEYNIFTGKIRNVYFDQIKTVELKVLSKVQTRVINTNTGLILKQSNHISSWSFNPISNPIPKIGNYVR